MSGAPRFSVVVLTRNRPQSLARCLRSVIASREGDWELVIVDNGSEAARQETRRLVSALPEAEKIRLVDSPPIGFARLRRLGFERACGAIVVSLDDDCELAPDAMDRIGERFETDSRIGIVGGNLQNVGFGADERLKGRGRLAANASWEPVEDPAQAEIFGSANHSILHSAYDAIGGYDPFFSAGLEEADLALGIRRRGYRIVYDPAVRVTHHHLPQRFRARWGNLHRMRLYLYFKHLPPRGAGAWLAFAATELRLALRDAGRLALATPQRYRAGEKGPGRRWAGTALWLAVESIKIVWSRLTIPELMWRARRCRLRQGESGARPDVTGAGAEPHGRGSAGP